jgi:hypothetical protein
MRLKRKWWFKSIREYNWFSFRYWWMNYLMWGVAISLLIWLILSVWNTANICNEQVEINRLLRKIDRELENCCECNEKVPDKNLDTIAKAPEANCRVHFSGLIMGGKVDLSIGISKIYEEDLASEYVGAGYYSNNNLAFPKAVSQTFDGIAIDKGTRLIIYSRPNFKGAVLLDVEGPLVINNILFKDNPNYSHCNSDTYPPELQATYPQSKRIWSSSDMQKWSNGSCKIICDK